MLFSGYDGPSGSSSASLTYVPPMESAIAANLTYTCDNQFAKVDVLTDKIKTGNKNVLFLN